MACALKVDVLTDRIPHRMLAPRAGLTGRLIFVALLLIGAYFAACIAPSFPKFRSGRPNGVDKGRPSNAELTAATLAASRPKRCPHAPAWSTSSPKCKQLAARASGSR